MATSIKLEVSREVEEANKNFEAKLSDLVSKGLAIDYDDEHDLFFLTLGEPREAVMEPTSDDFVYLSVDPDTLEIIGLAITAFRSKFLKQHPELQRLVKIWWKKPTLRAWQLAPDSPDAARAAKILRDIHLVTA